MSVHFDPRSTPVRTSGVDPLQRPSPSGISSAPSTIQGRLGANESRGGFCAWISRMISQLCEAIRRCFSSAPSSESSAPTISPLQARIATGRDNIDTHFNDLSRRNLARCAVVVMIKYNNGSVVPCRIISTSEGREAFKADCYRQMEELLGQDEHRNCNDGTLKISMKVFTKNPDNTFNFNDSYGSFEYPNGRSSGGQGSSQNNSRLTVARLLEPEIRSSSPERQQAIVAVIRNL